jgi:LPXTG-site transpeptidase (sortase) family protein
MIKKILKFLFIFSVTFVLTTAFLLFKDKFFNENPETGSVELPPELYEGLLSKKNHQNSAQTSPGVSEPSTLPTSSQTSTPSPTPSPTSLPHDASSQPAESKPSQVTISDSDILLISKLNVKAPIITPSFPQKEEFLLALQKGVALHPSFAKPGENGMVLIYGHSSRPRRFSGRYNLVFTNLNRLKPGDEIITYFSSQKFVYKVEKVITFYPNEEDKYLPKETQEKILVLLTCWPPGSDAKRLAVIAKISP